MPCISPTNTHKNRLSPHSHRTLFSAAAQASPLFPHSHPGKLSLTTPCTFPLPCPLRWNANILATYFRAYSSYPVPTQLLNHLGSLSLDRLAVYIIWMSTLFAPLSETIWNTYPAAKLFICFPLTSQSVFLINKTLQSISIIIDTCPGNKLNAIHRIPHTLSLASLCYGEGYGTQCVDGKTKVRRTQ